MFWVDGQMTKGIKTRLEDWIETIVISGKVEGYGFSKKCS